jgi:hypothetical protein
MPAEALALHLDGFAEDGAALPEPSTLEDVMAERENRDAVAILIEPPKSPGKSVRINITLPADALDEIDRTVAAHGLTRSGFLARAARRDLAG